MHSQAAAPPAPSEQEIGHAAHCLAEGRLAAFPTETVYGLGADAENPQAVARIYAAKGRPANHPVIVHIAPEGDVDYWAAQVPPEACKLMQAFWPGPLTLILKRAPHIPDAVSGGQDSIGLRCPSHPVAQDLLRAFAALKPNGQGGVAAPSANKFGQVSPTLAAHVRGEFPDEVAQGMPVLDGGAAEVGIESTIVAATGGPLRLLRRGPIDIDASEVSGRNIEAPGQLASHYAPRKPLRLDATSADDGEYLIGFGQVGGEVTLSERGDPVEAAARLFDLLHQADAAPKPRIAVAPVPGNGIAAAIRDRLKRAAAPRS